MGPVAWWLALLLHAGPTNPDLKAAERAYDEGRYQEVLPLLKRARKAELPRKELVRSLELEALTQAAFDHPEPAIEAFRYLLGADASWLPAPSASPKLLSLFAEARRRGPLGILPSLEPKPPPPPRIEIIAPDAGTPPPPETALYGHWWFWAGVGVVAAGAGAGAWYAGHPIVPSGSLGVGQMR